MKAEVMDYDELRSELFEVHSYFDFGFLGDLISE